SRPCPDRSSSEFDGAPLAVPVSPDLSPLAVSAVGLGQTMGKYFCSVDNIVGLQTNSQSGTRFAGRIDADAQQKFFVTIEENKQLPEDSLALLGVATLSAVIHVLGAIRARWPQWLSVQQANNPAG